MGPRRGHDGVTKHGHRSRRKKNIFYIQENSAKQARKCITKEMLVRATAEANRKARKQNKRKKQKKPDLRPNGDNPAPMWRAHTPHSSSSSSKLSVSTGPSRGGTAAAGIGGKPTYTTLAAARQV